MTTQALALQFPERRHQLLLLWEPKFVFGDSSFAIGYPDEIGIRKESIKVRERITPLRRSVYADIEVIGLEIDYRSLHG